MCLLSPSGGSGLLKGSPSLGTSANIQLSDEETFVEVTFPGDELLYVGSDVPANLYLEGPESNRAAK